MKTLFSKLTVIYIGLLLIAIIMVSVAVNQYTTYYFVNEAADQLLKSAVSVEELYQSAQETGEIDILSLRNEMRFLNKYLNADMWMISNDGQVFVSSDQEETQWELSSVSKENVGSVFAGETLILKGFQSQLYDDELLMIGYPLKIDDQVVFALFMSKKIPEIATNSSNFMRIILSTMVIVGTISILIISMITRAMSREIKELNDAVKFIAQGHFDKKIVTTRTDELGELATSFNEMADELAMAEESKSKFISNLSHDLRSPLTTISGYTSGILDGTIERDKQDRYLNIVLNESNRLAKMVNDILDISKLESGELVLNKVDFDIDRILLDELDSFEKRFIDKRVKLNLDLCHDPKLAHGDADAYRRVIFNLLDNALKFVDEDGAISLRSELKGDKYVVGVSNTGAVLTEEQLIQIWDRFSKLDSSRGLNKKSSGLGLSIVKEIIKAHGEKIDAYSNEDIGVAFIFSVPT